MEKIEDFDKVIHIAEKILCIKNKIQREVQKGKKRICFPFVETCFS